VSELYFKNEIVEYPVAITRLVPARGFQRSQGLVVDKCPFCGHTHRHSVSEWGGDGVYGLREADCMRGQYLLIDEDTLENHRAKLIEK
jgi:hypothetical protein